MPRIPGKRRGERRQIHVVLAPQIRHHPQPFSRNSARIFAGRISGTFTFEKLARLFNTEKAAKSTSVNIPRTPTAKEPGYSRAANSGKTAGVGTAVHASIEEERRKSSRSGGSVIILTHSRPQRLRAAVFALSVHRNSARTSRDEYPGSLRANIFHVKPPHPGTSVCAPGADIAHARAELLPKGEK